MKKRLMPILAILMMVLAACSGKTATEQHHDESPALAVGEEKQLPNGDLKQVTASAEQQPEFLDDKSENLQLVYQVAGHAEDILKYMPCYCGCADSADHDNNLNCFVDEIRKDGSVVWDDHGTRCDVCVEIAIKSVKMAQEGKSLKEIRATIDSDYKTGYARPTDTPMPS
ncbi:PCYCGC motif-containing lipoprotein [Sporosarcina jeotgali]|uniref:PCYCGC motif-containing lipoprotein n=1 Tax=Sporosarcina jeotgali TaxID=3020056 RepID=A0ABZ0KUB6_9BACL|nr:PCYCGC motif-containing (lipo)protein [Sporosarcina sp. B2O-1]WOV84024.1 PCYCGC motif-containing lipoprotein [Sporosarcina sp. B2O-1]